MPDQLPPLEGPGAQSDGLPPLEGPGARAPLEADSALGLRTLSPARASQRRVASYAGIPGSEIETTARMRDPMSGMPLDVDDLGQTQEVPDEVSENLRLATSGISSSSSEEARKALVLARDLGLGPDVILGKAKEFEATSREEETARKLSMLPAYSRLTRWMAQNRAHAAVIQNELDQWGTLDYVFGRYEYDPDEQQAWSRRHANQEQFGEYKFRPRAVYRQPGWYQALGRAMYATTTSMQAWFEKNYLEQDPAFKFDPSAGGPGREKAEEHRRLSNYPIPGDTVYMPDGEGGVAPAGKEHPVLRTVNSLMGMAPLVGVSMLHPLAGAAMIYTETAGRTYEDMRLEGWEHEHARDVSEMIGFANGSLAALTGPLFKFSFLPKETLGALSVFPNAALGTITKNPTFWRAAVGLGKNFVASTAMNMAMASSEVAIKEAYDSARAGRPYSYSKVASAAGDASHAWAEMLALSVVPAYEEHLARKQSYRAKAEVSQVEMDRARFVEQVYENYENRGRALRSMHEASQIVSAVTALKDSEFMRSNPEEARELVSSMIAPRGSQTVFVGPEAVAKLPPSMLDALPHDASLGVDDGRIPTSLTDLIMHPEGESLLPHVAGQIDLDTVRELTGIDLTTPEVTGANIPDERLDEFLASERERLRGRGVRIPTPEEINSAVQGAFGRRPAPDLGPRERPAAPSVSLPPITEAGLRRWALDAASRLPTRDLQAMALEHGQRAEAATQEALAARTAATEHARGQRDTQSEASEARALDAERRANVSKALHRALTDGVEEIRSHVDYFSKQASDERLPGGGLTPREAAWYAGEEFGAAHDTIMQALNLAENRSYAASDLSDLYDKLARLNKLPKDGFEGWDLRKSNELVQQRGTMPERSLEDLRVLRSALEQLGSAADAENSSRVMGIKVAKALMVEEIAEHLKLMPDVAPGQRMLADNPEALSNSQALDQGRGSVAAELNKPSTLMLKLGKVGEAIFFERFVPGTARENAMWGDVEPVVRMLDKTMPHEIKKLGRDKVKFLDGELHLRSDIWDLTLKLGTRDATSKIARGMGFRDTWNKGQVERTAEQGLWDWIHQNIADTPENAHVVMEKLITPHWRLFENYLWPQIEKMFKERGLAPPEKLKAQKITIHGKEYEGGYGGRLKWLDAKNKPVVHPGSLEALLDHDISGPYTDQRHLAERDPDFSGKPMFSWDGLVSDIKKEIHDVALRPFLEDAHKIFSDPEVRKLVGDKLGKQALNQVYDPGGQSDWLRTVARGSVGDVQSAKVWARALFKFQGLAAYSAFSLNTRVMLGQLSHIPAAMFGLGIEPAAMTSGFAAAFSPERRSWAHASSEVLSLRYANYEDRAIELTRQLTGLNPGRDSVRRATDHMNWMAWREMDAFLSHAIWEATYSDALHGLGEAATHDQAVRAADIAVTRMMPAQDIYDQSAFVRDRSVAGFSYMVRNFPNTLANVAALNWWNARLKGRALSLEGGVSRTLAAARFVGMVMAAEILGKGFIMQGGPRDRDDTEGWYQRRLFGAMAYPYMISEPVTAVGLAITGHRHEARQEMDRMLPASIGVVAQGIDDIGRFFQDGDEEAALRAAAHLAGLLAKTPLPSAAYNLSNAGRNSEDPIDATMKAMGYRR